MIAATDAEQLYYAKVGTITDPGQFVGLFDELPSEIAELCKIVQGLLVHVFWAERYGEKLTAERSAEAGLRHVEKMLARLQEIKGGPITESRQLSDRVVGNCRTFSVLLAAMLQSQGRPARARCGFGRYFTPGWHEDHWICETWSERQKRWIMVDAQLDAFQCRELKVKFDPLDVPRDQFIVAGKAWQHCRSGAADPDKFGIFDMHGLWFIRGNLVRDVAALNKVELLPWDGWGLIDCSDDEITQEQLILLDDIASKTYDEVNFATVRETYETNKGLNVPSIIKSYGRSGTVEVDLATEKAVR